MNPTANCKECGKPLPTGRYSYKFCPPCRTLYGIWLNSEVRQFPYPAKGRDRFSERLRDGFRMLDDTDPED